MREPRTVFRDRRTAISAVLTAALLTSLEVSDARRGTQADDDVDDQGTGAWFALAMGVAISSSLVALGRSARPRPRRPGRWWTGIALIWTGAAVNRSARRALGGNYRARLTIVDGHEVVESGPYRIVRHPMYAGATLICFGCGLAVEEPASATWALPALALLHRVRVEEALLRSELGDRYDDFAQGRARLVPGVW
jgi:protein-S-isoprenylcysteine O-methyltransferase Ste14